MNVRNSYREASIQGATAVQIVIRLYEQMIDDMRQVSEAIGKNDVQRRTDRIKHAIYVVGYLQSILDFDRGGKVARDLENFYAALRHRFFALQCQPALRAAAQLITDLLAVRSAWIEVDRVERPATALALGLAAPATEIPTPRYYGPGADPLDSDSPRPSEWLV